MIWEKVKVEEKGKAAGQVKAQANLQVGAGTTTLRREKASSLHERIDTHSCHGFYHLVRALTVITTQFSRNERYYLFVNSFNSRKR